MIIKIYKQLDYCISEKLPKAAQVKEKFGLLRMYLENGTDSMYNQIHIAEEKSQYICEECGKEGKLRPGNYIRTLCDKCAGITHDELTKEDLIKYEDLRLQQVEIFNKVVKKIRKIHKICSEVYNSSSYYGQRIAIDRMDGLEDFQVYDNGFSYSTIMEMDENDRYIVGTNTKFITYEVLEMTNGAIKQYFLDMKGKELLIIKEMKRKEEEEKSKKEKENKRIMYEQLKIEFEGELK